MKLSIIIPCYNAEQYVDSCIEKLEGQLDKANLYDCSEIIMIDDGSTDNTYNECIAISSVYNNVSVLFHNDGNGNHLNLYQAKTRELGLKNANGEWVTFLDIDDYYDDTYKEFFSLINGTEADIIFSGYKVIVDGKNSSIVSGNIDEKKYSRNEFTSFLQDKITYDQVSCIGGKFYSRSFLVNNNISFSDDYRHNEDAAFAIAAMLAAETVVYSKLSSYLYIQRNGSMMHTYRNDQYFSINRVYSLLENLYKTAGLLDRKRNNITSLRAGLAINTLLNSVETTDYKTYKEDFYKLYKEDELRLACEEAIGNSTVNKKKSFLLKLFLGKRVNSLFLFLKIYTRL